MANVLNLSGNDYSNVALAEEEEAERQSNARLLSERLEAQVRPKTMEEKLASQRQAVIAARERNARRSNGQAASGDEDVRATGKARNTESDDFDRPKAAQHGGDQIAQVGKTAAAAGKALEATGVGAELGVGLQAAGKGAQIISDLTSGFKNTLQKVGYGSVFLMVFTALFFDVLKDLVELVPIAGWIMGTMIAGLANATFLLWFKIKELKWNKTKAIIFILGAVVDMTPIINAMTIIPCTITLVLSIMNESAEKVIGELPGGKQALQAMGEDMGVTNNIKSTKKVFPDLAPKGV